MLRRYLSVYLNSAGSLVSSGSCIRLEQEIEELETGVPAKKAVANENGGEFKANRVAFKGTLCLFSNHMNLQDFPTLLCAFPSISIVFKDPACNV